ncbi:hypothetical protein BJ912DRAFT_700494 [Pholiota molesta]|nr:hypothetical protein BJ912DRAFT_700494 [Pholiota molesta]
MRTFFNFVALLLPLLVLSTPLRFEESGAQLHELGAQDAFARQKTAPHARRGVDVEHRSLQQIYEAALKEKGTLQVAWGGDVQQSKSGVMKAFQAKFPGVNINLILNPSKYLDSGIDYTYKKTNGTDNGVDVAVIQTTYNFLRWKRQGRLLPYKVIPWNDISPQFVDPDGAYMGLYIFSFGAQVYNPETTNSTSLPKDYLDFLRPEWYNKIILPYPNDDDAVLYLFKLITDKYGFDYIHALQQQNVHWVRGTATPSILIANTNPNDDIDADTGARNAASISFASSHSFAPGVATHTMNDVRMVWPQTGAIFARTKMPESARLFLNFLMDDAWQAVVSEGEFATRRKYDRAGVFSQPGLDPLGYGMFMADRQQVEALRFQFEAILGTPEGDNPVKVW